MAWFRLPWVALCWQVASTYQDGYLVLHGGCTHEPYHGGCTEAPCHGAAFYKRKGVAIPDDELARLGLSSSSIEAQEAAGLFWAGEELTDLGNGRFYPCRQALWA